MNRIASLTLIEAICFGIFFNSVMPSNAQIPCKQWNVGVPWIAVQGKFRVTFKVQQSGAKLYGPGWYSVGNGPAKRTAMVNGTIQGNSLELHTGWGGVYIGKIDATGRIDGWTYDKNDSKSQATWYSDRRMRCLVY